MTSLSQAARDVKRDLARLARPSGALDASRYFRNAGDLGFYNVGTDRLRAMAKAIVRVHEDAWTVDDAAAFADLLISDRYLDVKTVAVETMACYRRSFTPSLLPIW